MFRVPPLPLAALLVTVLSLVVAVGCVSSGGSREGAALPRDGEDRYRLVAGEARSLAGCRYDYRVYEPRPAAGETGAPATVVLGHGFLRDQDTLVGLGRALANDGHRAVTLDFCNMKPWNGHHERNARDLRALAGRLADGPLVYAGFSAGALAAVLAASEDPAALGVVTLDLVDQADLASRALAAADVPIVGLQGPPSACNANGSGQRVFETRPDAPLVTFDGASHCEFESPTNRLCELACGDDDAVADDVRVREDIVRSAVAAVDRLLDAARGEGTGTDILDPIAVSRSVTSL